MEIFYNVYTKTVQNKLYYFVKKYLSFPEYKDLADIIHGYGMHTDFNKACRIAGINDLKIRKKLFDEMLNDTPQARVIDLNASEMILSKKIVL